MSTVEIPMPYKGEMVRAILDDTKTQTRRLWKMPRGMAWYHSGPLRGEETGDLHDLDGPGWCSVDEVRCPYGRPGARHWVREAWRASLAYELRAPRDIPAGSPLLYEADHGGTLPAWNAGRFRPPMFMPRWASRITCEVTDVRVERLQDISAADALAEGIVAVRGGFGLPAGEHFHNDDPRESYWSLWEAINGPGSVEANPWIWAVTFRRLP